MTRNALPRRETGTSEWKIPVGDGEVWAQDSGGDGPPVVMLHPGVGDSRIWDPVLALCPGVTGYPWPDDPAENEEVGALIKAADLAGLTEFGLREFAAAGHDEAARAQLRSAAAGWLAEADYQQDGPPVSDRLGEISAPAVLLIGDLDRAPLIACAAATADRIPGCRLITVPGADHLLPLRAPVVVAQAIQEQLG